MLTISQMSKGFAGRVLFEDVTLQINRGDRIGLVGPNGAGKSTLFNLILGNDTPDTGSVTFERGSTVGYLPQETAPVANETVLEIATSITPEVAELSRRIKMFEAGHDTDSHDFHEIQAKFDSIGGYTLEPRAKAILRGLAFRDGDFEREARTMSGGWGMRAYLARLLVQQPDLLMLDEPTNHLDLEALQWFQEYLKNYPGAILLISHDREFLNALCGNILEIAHEGIIRYRGNYEDFLVQRAANEEQLLAAYKNQQKKIDQLQDFANRFRAKASKAAQAQSKLKQIERMDKIEAPLASSRTFKFRFPQPLRSGLRVITLKDINHAYGDNVVYHRMNFHAERHQRVVLVGPNGAGKSTLLKLLAGVLPVQTGHRELGHNVKTGYYAQHRVEMLQMGRTVLEEASDLPTPLPEQTIRTVLGSFLFTGDNVFKPVGVLSGGEKSRLALVKLLLDPPNLLLMDEPTTHLDMASIDALISALEQFEGTLIFISHDVYFIRKLAKHVLHINAGKLTPYHGDYQYYLDKTSALNARDAVTAGGKSDAEGIARDAQTEPSAPQSRKEQKRAEAEARNARSRDRRAAEKLVADLEKKIDALETKQAELTAELEDPATYQSGRAVPLNRELTHVVDDLTAATAEWEQAAAKLDELTAVP